MPEDLFEREGVPHSNTRYTTGRCRCDICKADHALYQLEGTIKRRERIAELPDEAHGRLGTYTNWGCRCTRCRSRWAANSRLARARLKAAAAVSHETSVAPVQSVDQTQSVITCDLGFTHIVVS